MTPAEHGDALEAEGIALVEAAAGLALAHEVPTCPGWQVRHLLRHVGYVHRWAARCLGASLAARVDPASEAEVLHAEVPDGGLLSWVAAGHRELIATLRAAPADLRCWTFVEAASPLQFWARRQAHETSVHRVDAQIAAGALPTVSASFAADGVDELVIGFAGRSGRIRGHSGRVLALRATDAARAWRVEIGARGQLTVSRGSGPADCTVAGPAGDLSRALWNRLGPERLAGGGDARLLAGWRRDVRITWS
ncbi:MAG TPA: maleylpyruvate isomerase family mycothiol-dependent enzyme [Verrucomicrobiae bacterium]|nr:maleylpyruvate isomerase family mycothiol-dependent enzyme [Verrucomicrobiae bacterium]